MVNSVKSWFNRCTLDASLSRRSVSIQTDPLGISRLLPTCGGPVVRGAFFTTGDSLMRLFIPFAILCFALVAAGAAAQCTPGAGLVELSVNGTAAAGQLITLAGEPGGTTTISLTDTTGAPGDAFILAAGNGIVCQSIFLVFGGTIDITSPMVVLNGLAPTTVFDAMAKTDFAMTYPTECSVNGITTPAIQAIHVAPTMPPYFVRETGAIQIAYAAASTIVTTYENWGDDAAVYHSTQNCPGSSANMLFGTVAYQHAYICSNGPITFTGGTDDFGASAADLFSGWAGGFPGVAPRWEDMANSAALNDKLIITEDVVNNTVEFSFLGNEHWGSGAPLGDWTCTFGLAGPGSVVIDLTNALPGGETDVVGVSDGGAAGPTGAAGLDSIVDLDVAAAAFYTTAVGTGPESICEEFAAGTTDNNIYTFIDLTGTFEWTLF